MAFPALSALHQSPFFNTAHHNGANQFGFYLASSGSELYLGGTDRSKYSTSIEYHRVNPSTGFWQLTGASAKVGGAVAASNFQTIIDSGTTIMYGPPAAVKAVYAKVPGSAVFDSSAGTSIYRLYLAKS
jgi:cathepsin D